MTAFDMARWIMNFMDNGQVLAAAMEQSAVDLGCRPEDFGKKESVIVYSGKADGARKYLELPFFCNLVSYGGNIVASVDPGIEQVVRDYITRYTTAHCFETPNLHVLSDAFAPFGMKICFMAEYFLPDMNELYSGKMQELIGKVEQKGYELRLLSGEDFAGLYTSKWSNALCEKRKELDVLGIGAYEGGKLIGLAGCSADCDSMWQIGVDVLEEHRRQGIAAALTNSLAKAILEREKLPFYCAAWSNIGSVRNAVKAGFRPAWVEMTAKSAEFVDELIKGGQ